MKNAKASKQQQHSWCMAGPQETEPPPSPGEVQSPPNSTFKFKAQTEEVRKPVVKQIPDWAAKSLLHSDILIVPRT